MQLVASTPFQAPSVTPRPPHLASGSIVFNDMLGGTMRRISVGLHARPDHLPAASLADAIAAVAALARMRNGAHALYADAQGGFWTTPLVLQQGSYPGTPPRVTPFRVGDRDVTMRHYYDREDVALRAVVTERGALVDLVGRRLP
jgi:hypothetical protein